MRWSARLPSGHLLNAWLFELPGAALDLRALKIISGQRCWHVYVDALVINADGNLFDAVSIAAKVQACESSQCALMF